VASARGQGKKHPRSKSSPAHVAALIGGAALLLLLGVKIVGILNSEAGRELLARTGGNVEGWLGRFITLGPAPGDVPVAEGLEAALRPLGIASQEIQREVLTEVASGRRQAERWDVPVPRRVALVQVNMAVTQTAPGLGLEVLDAWEERRSASPTLYMDLGRAGKVSHQLRFARSEKAASGQVAIVISGFGGTWGETAKGFLGFTEPITLAVLPGFRGSRKIADAARARGFEVLLALPMEPLNYPRVDPGREAILVDQSPAQMRARIRKTLRSVGEVSGISSHMGSRATTDRDVMRIVLDETRRQGLFFVDAGAAERPVTRDVARRLGTTYLISGLSLDSESAHSQRAISARIDEMMRMAEETGEVVAFGHGYPETLAALTAALPEFAARGIELVPVSSLTRAQVQARAQAEGLKAEPF
jgi:polysaccharide deacetylase 2 family uncharacterized protein YibQ